MIDNVDFSVSTIKLLASQALKSWSNKAVLRLLLDEDYVVRTLAARELQIRGDKEIFDHVVTLRNSQNGFLREICAFILGQFGTPNMPLRKESVPILLELIADDMAEVRAASAATLGHICFDGMPFEVENALYLAASDKDADVRCCVASSLGSASNKKEVTALLKKMLLDSDENVREYAELGIDILNSTRNGRAENRDRTAG